jgi:hypothetical protein
MLELLFSSPLGQWFFIAFAVSVFGAAVLIARLASPERRMLTFFLVIAVGIVIAVPVGVAFMMIAFVVMGIMSGGSFL